jgi:hypothetical protein
MFARLRRKIEPDPKAARYLAVTKKHHVILEVLVQLNNFLARQDNAVVSAIHAHDLM